MAFNHLFFSVGGNVSLANIVRQIRTGHGRAAAAAAAPARQWRGHGAAVALRQCGPNAAFGAASFKEVVVRPSLEKKITSNRFLVLDVSKIY